MKSRILLVTAVVAASVTAVAVAKSTEKKPISNTKVVTIEELVAKPFQHVGKARVEGVVASVGKDTLILISEKEYKECGIACTDEPNTRLPVRWVIPEAKDKVSIEGEVKKEGKSVAFIAERIKKL